MSNEFVFVGPSLSREEVAALRPAATILPPVEHGDLLRLDAGPGDRVLMIDGLFMRAAPVRHREILYLLERGVTVAGSSSMGALRAAELWPFGMRGVGEVFAMYRDGEVSGDDEVAIVHGPAEEGYRPLSVPLVNIRVALKRGVAAGAITAPEAAALTEAVRAVPFRMRGYRALERLAGQRVPGDAVDRFLAWHHVHPSDAKAEDARLLLTRYAAPAPHSAADTPIDHPRTTFLEIWRARHGGARAGDRWVPDTAAIAAVMLLHPRYPAEHRRAVLARIAGEGAPGPVADGHAEPVAEALAAAARRGLLVDEPTDSPAWDWLTPAERGLDRDERLLRLLTRSFGTAVHAAIGRWLLPSTLDRPDIMARARQVVATAERLNDRLPRLDPHQPERRMRFRPEAIDRTFARLWGCDDDDLLPAVHDRGLADLDSFRLAAEPLVAYLKMFATPAEWAARSGEPAAA